MAFSGSGAAGPSPAPPRPPSLAGALPAAGAGVKKGAAPRGLPRPISTQSPATSSRAGSANGGAVAAAAMVAMGRPQQMARARSESPAVGVGRTRSWSRSGTPPSAAGGDAAAALRGPQLVNKEVLLAATSQQRGKESVDQFLGKITHLQLQGQRLGPELGEALQFVPAATVLYAYDNLLSGFAGLQYCKRLTMLYLQNNRLATMSGLEACTNLRVLHLGHNRLSRVECLENCKQLEELHVSHQKPRLEDGDEHSLEFCPNSLAAVAYSLQSLSAAGNRLRDAGPLTMLQQLQSLDLSGNEFAQAGDVKDLLSNPYLIKVELHGNPFAMYERKYRTSVVLHAPAIEEIDGRAVLPQERDFVRRLEEQKRKLQVQRRMHFQKKQGFGGSPSSSPPVATTTSLKSGGPGGGGMGDGMGGGMGGTMSGPAVLQDVLVA